MKTKKLIQFSKEFLIRTKKNKRYKKKYNYTKKLIQYLQQNKQTQKKTKKKSNIIYNNSYFITNNYNFSNNYLCRWCGSNCHKTECCVLNSNKS